MNGFEEWARWFALDLSKNSSGEYLNFATVAANKAWQFQENKIKELKNENA